MSATEQSILASLQSSRYLASVPEDSLRSFLPLIRYERFPQGRTLISQGEANRDIFIILNGQVEVEADQQPLYNLGRNGDIFGETTVVTGQASPATVRVTEPLEALVVSSLLLQEVKEDSSHELSFLFYDWISRILADKLHLTSEKAKRFEETSTELREALEKQQQISDNLRKTTFELEQSKAELEELNNLKTELIGIASHDLRSPIGSVITVMETIPSCYELDAELIDLLKEVKETCNDQLVLVNSLLDLAKIESGRLELEPTQFSESQLIDIFRQVEKRARLLSRSKQLKVELDIAALVEASGNRPDFIGFDVPKVQQVLNNLIGNAIKFTPDGGQLSLRVRCNPEDCLEVSVADSGVGIPPAEQGQIFDKFHQVRQRKTGTRGEKGTGLGLAICRNMVELHGGKIWVESEDGAGSTFFFTLPLSPAA